jgi:hypothetical protein
MVNTIIRSRTDDTMYLLNLISWELDRICVVLEIRDVNVEDEKVVDKDGLVERHGRGSSSRSMLAPLSY